MKSTVLAGIILAVVGVVALGYQGFTYTTREKVVDIGPIEITQNKKHSVPIAPIVGAGALLAGIMLVVQGSKKS